ncbi:hypothetical protein [Paraburkholderia graminis]|uniref:Uncharacterized protein n=1 Tax=Paraburkholderia graminis (strain ATCC 700544 / DSM 17151 / LMG 18924 / NCIMB 13744 / C4D1M) TaxID=396598 RepID=B1G4X9_PARG4|nr:hypothetical protein [Paraburkholderia graminis]EDT08748.1 hypothetical protein BgramDRAFT_4402 [Paraburkholderia graminis C4D1M]
MASSVVDLFEGYLDKVELPAARKDAAGLAQREKRTRVKRVGAPVSQTVPLRAF